MTTKIGFLRDEFLRIGCIPPALADPFQPRIFVGWHFTKIRVLGLQDKIFEYDHLCRVLKEIPDGAGEEVFWQKVSELNPEPLLKVAP